MEFVLPPLSGRHKLIATVKHDEELYLALLSDGRPLNVKWEEVNKIEDEDLKHYLLSMKYGIEQGIYDAELLEI